MATNKNTSAKVNTSADAIVNVLTADNFFLTVGKSVYRSTSGDVEIVVTEKVSNYTSGKLTVYSGRYGDTEITRKPVGYWKKVAGAVINHRDTSAINAVKVMSDDEITNKVLAYQKKVENVVNALNGLLAAVDFAAVSIDTVAAVDAYRAKVVARNEDAKKAADDAKAAAAARAEKAARRDTAKAVMDMSAENAAALAALIASGVNLADLLAAAQKSA